MRAYLWQLRVKKGSESIDIAREQRKGEEPLLESGLEWLRKELDRVGRKQKSQPYVIKHLSEGATSLSMEEQWGPRVNSAVASRGGFLIDILNIGDKLGSIPDDEYLKRKEAIMNLVNERGRPPLIITTGCFRLGDSIIYDKGHFDERYLEAIYILDRCAIGQPLGDDLSNALRSGGIYTITTPVGATNFEDLMKAQIEKTSFMFAGTLGTGRSAPLVLEAERRVDSITLIANTENYLRNIMLSLEGKWPGRRIVAYALAEAEEKLRIPFIPRVRSREPIKGWGKESFHGFFTASLSVDEVEEALEMLRATLRRK
jgi:hypothetical protein